MGEKLINLKQLRQALIRAKGQISGVAGAAAAAIEEVAVQKQNKLTGLPGQAVGFDSMGNAAVVRGWSNLNLLDNWYFPGPINQKGQTTYDQSGYIIDRWINWDAGHSVSVTSEGLFSSSDAVIVQRLYVEPGTYTQTAFGPGIRNMNFFVYYFGDLHQTENISGGDLLSATFVVPEEARGKLCHVAFGLKGGYPVKAAKLEPGTQQTLAYKDANGNWILNDPPPNKALELAKCQSYFRMFTGKDKDVATIGLFVEREGKASVAIPVSSMRTMPAISFSGEFRAITSSDEIHSNNVTCVTQQSIGSTLLCHLDGFEDLPSGGCGWIDMLSDAVITLDANL